MRLKIPDSQFLKIITMKTKKYTFHKIGNQISSGWYCLINNSQTLLDYLDYMGKRQYKNWCFIKDSPESKDGHCKTQEASNLKTLLTLEMSRKGIEEMSMPAGLNYLIHVSTKSVIEVFNREGEVYASRKGACRPSTKLLDCEKVIEERYSNEFIFPSNDYVKTEIKRWPLGKHFYILIDGISVEIEGQVKWNTVKAAEEALADYVKESKINSCGERFAESCYETN